jgi:hypothetical protein
MCNKKDCPIYKLCDKTREQIAICTETESNLKEFSKMDVEFDEFLDFAVNQI